MDWPWGERMKGCKDDTKDFAWVSRRMEFPFGWNGKGCKWNRFGDKESILDIRRDMKLSSWGRLGWRYSFGNHWYIRKYRSVLGEITKWMCMYGEVKTTMYWENKGTSIKDWEGAITEEGGTPGTVVSTWRMLSARKKEWLTMSNGAKEK